LTTFWVGRCGPTLAGDIGLSEARSTISAKEALIKSNGDAASAMPKSVLLNRICAMQMQGNR